MVTVKIQLMFISFAERAGVTTGNVVVSIQTETTKGRTQEAEPQESGATFVPGIEDREPYLQF